MMKLVEYLHQTKTILNDGFRDVDCVHVVISNESCDLDSAVCAVAWAYYLNLSVSKTTVAVIPLLNIPQQKYYLRTETTFLFRNHGISDDLLTFCDDLDLHDLQRQQKLKLSLVDHNVLPEKYSDLDDYVISVTDHRPQVRKPDNRVKINIAPVGSCSTLVTEDILSQTDFEVDNTILKLLYGAILIDTINLSPVAGKMTERDVAMVGRLEELIPDVNRDDLYNNIKKAKTDITELTTGELLEKDLKIVSGNKVKIAMSSVSMELQNLMSRDNLLEDFDKFAKGQSVSAVVVMMLYEVSPGQPLRDIALYSTKKVLQEKICNCLTKEKDPDLKLTLVSAMNQNVIAYHQGCIKASRKVVLPIIQKAVYEHENEILPTDKSNTAPLDTTQPLDDLNLLNNQSPAYSAVTLDNSENNSGTNKNINTSNNDLLSDIQPNTGSNSDCLSRSSEVNAANILLGDLDLFATPSSHEFVQNVNNLQSNIPEISINNNQDVFDEVDIMFQAPSSRTSQCSSANTSEPGSAFTSYPVTPPNSFIDTSGHLDMKNFTLPSLNSAEMLEKIQEKKGRLRSSESTSVDDDGGNSVPYTPQNSFMEGVFEQYAKDHQLPSFNSIEMVQRIKQKRSSMEMSRLDEDEKLRSDSIEVTPYTPHNSYRDISLLDNNAWTFLDTNKLQQSLEKIEHVAKRYALHENLQKINDRQVQERTDSGLVIFDTSDLFNPTTIDNNIVAVGLAQEMIKWETTADNLLLSFDEAPSDGGNKKTDSSSLEKKSSRDETQSSSSSDSIKFDIKGGKSDFKTETLLFHQSIDEFARNLTGKLIDEAIIAFPETDEEIEGSEIFGKNHLQQGDKRNLMAPTFTEPIFRSSPEDLPVETDYLSSVDPLHGNLNLTEDNQEIAESISFRKVSGEEPQTVRQELLQHYAQEKVDEESGEGVDGYAAKLVQHVISGAIATVTSTFNTTYITKESGVTWSREESRDTVSSLPLNQTSAERLNLDQTFNSDKKQNVSKEMQETLDYHSFSSKQFNEPVAGISESSFENSNGAMNNDYIKDKVSVLKPSDPQLELLSVLSNSSSMENETAENEMSKSGKIDNVSAKCETNVSKPSVGSLNLHKMESVDYISSEDETDKLSPLKLEHSGLLHQSLCVDKEFVPCNFGKKESVGFISSEGESDNSVQSQAAEKPTYHKADTVDYISSEGEGPGIYSSQSSESTSTTTEGSYQVISPDQQLIDIKGEMSELIKTEIGAKGTNMVSEIKQGITDVCESSDLKKSFSDNNFEKIISNDSLNSGNSVISEKESEKLDLRGSNSEVKIVNSPELRIEKQDDNLDQISVFDDKVTNSEQENASSKKKEIYMTSVGRISIASDEEHTASSRQLTSYRFMEESHKENEFDKRQSLKTNEITTKHEDPVNLDKGDNQSNINSDITQVKIGTDNNTANFQKQCTEGTEILKGADSVKQSMDLTEEWHEDPIPGMEHNDTDSSDSRYSSDSESDNSDRPANRPSTLRTPRKKRIAANFDILKEDYTSPDDIDTTDNAGDLEWENDTPVSIPSEPIPEYSADDEYQDAKHWRGVEINGKQQKIDLKVIDPYKKVLSHGGYYGDGLNAIIVFSGCYLPDRNRKDYQYVMNNLFLYVISTLELLVAEDYMIVYFHGATPRRQMPSFGWLKKCYQMIDRRLKKNLKGLLLLHPTLWLRTIVLMTKPFISSKFSSKLRFVRTLHDLSKIVPMEYIYVPDQVQKYDRNLFQPPHSPLPPPLHHTDLPDNTDTTDMSKCRRNLSRPETQTSTETQKEDG